MRRSLFGCGVRWQPGVLRKVLFSGVLCTAVLGCAGSQIQTQSSPHAGLSLPHRIAEGDTGKAPLAPAGSTNGAKGSGSTPKKTKSEAPARPPAFLPDPEPLVTADQLAYVVRFKGGQLSIESVRPAPQPKAVATPRMMGRYAFELWIGKELIERLRFDFPLLAAEDPSDDPARPSLAAGADVRRTLLIPNSLRATHAQIVDRATGSALVVPWPPSVSESPQVVE